VSGLCKHDVILTFPQRVLTSSVIGGLCTTKVKKGKKKKHVCPSSSSPPHFDRRRLSIFSPTLLPFSLLACLGVVSFFPFRLFGAFVGLTGHAPKILIAISAFRFKASHLLRFIDAPVTWLASCAATRQVFQNLPPNLGKSYLERVNKSYFTLNSDRYNKCIYTKLVSLAERSGGCVGFADVFSPFLAQWRKLFLTVSMTSLFINIGRPQENACNAKVI